MVDSSNSPSTISLSISRITSTETIATVTATIYTESSIILTSTSPITPLPTHATTRSTSEHASSPPNQSTTSSSSTSNNPILSPSTTPSSSSTDLSSRSLASAPSNATNTPSSPSTCSAQSPVLSCQGHHTDSPSSRTISLAVVLPILVLTTTALLGFIWFRSRRRRGSRQRQNGAGNSVGRDDMADSVELVQRRRAAGRTVDNEVSRDDWHDARSVSEQVEQRQ